jgi:hypothetical protein
MAKKALQENGGETRSAASEAKPAKAKRLSKLGEWRKANPNGFEVIYCDMRAVMK